MTQEDKEFRKQLTIETGVYELTLGLARASIPRRMNISNKEELEGLLKHFISIRKSILKSHDKLIELIKIKLEDSVNEEGKE